ncbi:hypothetical protein HQ544_02495 [Candidatus Falkowbacteria bacterium]|nr:hypothetical protein [Candidatus Falkowbacteria bacterium]
MPLIVVPHEKEDLLVLSCAVRITSIELSNRYEDTRSGEPLMVLDLVFPKKDVPIILAIIDELAKDDFAPDVFYNDGALSIYFGILFLIYEPSISFITENFLWTDLDSYLDSIRQGKTIFHLAYERNFTLGERQGARSMLELYEQRGGFCLCISWRDSEGLHTERALWFKSLTKGCISPAREDEEGEEEGE